MHEIHRLEDLEAAGIREIVALAGRLRDWLLNKRT